MRELDLSLPAGLLLVLVGLAAAGLGIRSWMGLNDREPLLAGLPAGGAHQREVPPPRQVRHAVIIITDGLTVDLGLALEPIRRLASQGITAEAEAANPTFSRAMYVTWLAGLDPVDSGARTSRYQGVFPLDSVLARARAAGLHTLVFDESSETKLGELFSPHVRARLAGVEAWPEVLRRIQQTDLAVLSLITPDQIGHRHGSTSTVYQAAAQSVGQQISSVVASLDLRQDLLVVLNDHGHLPAGGHGGVEPVVRRLFLVAAGAGVRRGVRGRMDQKDLAPTVAHLLGLLPPAHNRGWSLGWALDPSLPADFFEAAFASQYPARHRVEEYLARELGAELPDRRNNPRPEDLVRASLGNLGEARRLGWHVLQVLQHRVDGARLDRLKDLRVRRGVWLGALLLIAAVLMGVGRRLRLLRRITGGVFLGLLAAAVTIAVLYLLDVRLSFSQAGPRNAWLLRMVAAAEAGAVLHLLLAFVLPDRAPDGPVRAALVGRLLAGAWVISAIALAGYTLVPVAPGAALPDGRVMAGATYAWVCWVSYLLLLGLILTLAGLRRPRRAAPPDTL